MDCPRIKGIALVGPEFIQLVARGGLVAVISGMRAVSFACHQAKAQGR